MCFSHLARHFASKSNVFSPILNVFSVKRAHFSFLFLEINDIIEASGTLSERVNHLFRNTSLKLQYILSFMLILLVVILFMSVIYENNRESNIRYVNTTALDKFTNAAESISATIQSLDDLASLAAAENLSAAGQEQNASFDSQVIAMIDRLKSRLADDVRVFLLIRSGQDVYTENERLRYNEFESLMQEEYDLAMSQFYYHCSFAKDYALIPILKQDGTPGAIARIVPILSEDQGNSYSLVFLLPEELLTSELERYLGDLTGDVYIYDYYYTAMYCHLSETEPQAPYSQLIRQKGVGLQEFDANTVTLSVSHAERGLNYLLCESRDSFYAELQDSQHRLLLRILLLIGALLVLLVWLIYFNYVPIRRLTSEIIGEDSNTQARNELTLIKNSYDHTVEEVEKLSDQVSGLLPMASEHFLLRWIQGQIPTQEIFDNLTRYFDLSFRHAFFAAVYLPTIALADSEADKEKLAHLLKIFHLQQISTLSGALPDENAMLLIVNYDDFADGTDELATAAKLLRKSLDHGGFEDIHFGVGLPCRDPLKLSDSYWEACVAVQLSRGEEARMCFYASQISETAGSPGDPALPPMPVFLMTSAIGRGDSVVARRALMEITAHIRSNAESLLIFRYYTSNLLSVILDAAKNNHAQYAQSSLRPLIEYNSIQEFEEKAVVFVEEICLRVLQNQELANTSIQNKLMSYILEHYKDYSLSNQSVAENTGIPNKQITNIIRQETGMNFVQYVSYLRLNEFKRLLRETDRSITELVDEIGYSDVSNFLRKFKTMESMTASQYRIQYALSLENAEEET